MSLTKEQWIEMWEAIKRIEYQAKENRIALRKDREVIKQMIQSVIGKME